MESDAIAAAFRYPEIIGRFFELSPCPLLCITAGTVWEDLYWIEDQHRSGHLRKRNGKTARRRLSNLSGFTYAFNLNITYNTIECDNADITCHISDTKKVKPLRRLIKHLNDRSVCIMGNFTATNAIPGVINYLFSRLAVEPFFNSAFIQHSYLTPGDVIAVWRRCFGSTPIKFYCCTLVEPINICEILSLTRPSYLELDIKGIDYSPTVTTCRCSHEALQYCEMIRMEYLPDDWHYQHFFTYVMKNGGLTRLKYIYLTFQNTIVTQKYVKEVYKEAVTTWKNYPNQIYCIAGKPLTGRGSRKLCIFFGVVYDTELSDFSEYIPKINGFYHLSDFD